LKAYRMYHLTQQYEALTRRSARFRQRKLAIMRTGGSVMPGLMRIPEHGTRRLKGQVPPKGAVTDVMQVVQPQHPAYVSICSAGTSGTVRLPVRLTWLAGPGSGTGAGVAPPAIKAFRGG